VKKRFFALFCLNIMFSFLHASSFEDHKKAHMIQDLEVIKHHFEAGYAPAEWKKEYAGWDLNQAFEESKNEILSHPSITTKEFQKILRGFVRTMKDYHVDIVFSSTEASSLPFSIKGREGRYFIDWVDPIRLPPSHYGIRAGDELLEFDESPIAEVMTPLIHAYGKSSNPLTDLGYATMKLTMRSGMEGDDVPKGPIMVMTRSAKSGKIAIHQLRWAYTPEQIKSPLDFMEVLNNLSFLFPKTTKEKPSIKVPKIMMANPLHRAFAQKYAARDGALGSRKSFIPPLGKVIWSVDNDFSDDSSDPSSCWHGYIYRHPQGQKIGYIRIPHYLASYAQVQEFGKILNIMEEKSDALVIDQLHNFGGFVNCQYALAAMLTDRPMKAPYHRIKMTQKEVLEAYELLQFLNVFDFLLGGEEEGSHPFSSSNSSSSSSDSYYDDEGSLQSDEDDDERWMQWNYQEFLFLKDYCEILLEDWNQGLTLTRPTPILGIDRINPNPKYQYTKPILMLIDEMDFSGGDFMPAVLQDNRRALLFGARTAGAGGYVFSFQFPNSHGIAQCSYTASIAERSNAQKIENLGITPDIEYEMKSEDFQARYQGYVKAVNEAVETLLEK